VAPRSRSSGGRSSFTDPVDSAFFDATAGCATSSDVVVGSFTLFAGILEHEPPSR
jgi:hypothetical protein